MTETTKTEHEGPITWTGPDGPLQLWRGYDGHGGAYKAATAADLIAALTANPQLRSAVLSALTEGFETDFNEQARKLRATESALAIANQALGKAQGEAEGHAIARRGVEAELAAERARVVAAEAMVRRGKMMAGWFLMDRWSDSLVRRFPVIAQIARDLEAFERPAEQAKDSATSSPRSDGGGDSPAEAKDEDADLCDRVEHEGRIAMRWSEIIAGGVPRPFRAFRKGYHVAREASESTLSAVRGELAELRAAHTDVLANLKQESEAASELMREADNYRASLESVKEDRRVQRVAKANAEIALAECQAQFEAAQAELATQLTELQGLYAAFQGSGHSPKNPREAAQAIGQMVHDDEWRHLLEAAELLRAEGTTKSDPQHHREWLALDQSRPTPTAEGAATTEGKQPGRQTQSAFPLGAFGRGYAPAVVADSATSEDDCPPGARKVSVYLSADGESLAFPGGSFTTVRACRHCGVLITGGPTACVHCVVAEAAEAGEAERLMAELACAKGMRDA